jgi:hypothetical protein
MQNTVVIAVLGWIMVTIIMSVALFVAFNIILVVASLLVWESIFTTEVAVNLLRLSAIAGGVLAAMMMSYDWAGFKEAWSSWGDDD